MGWCQRGHDVGVQGGRVDALSRFLLRVRVGGIVYTHCDPIRRSCSGTRTGFTGVGGTYDAMGAGVAGTASAWVVSLLSKIRAAWYGVIPHARLWSGDYHVAPFASGAVGRRMGRARSSPLTWALFGPIGWLGFQ